MSESAVFRPDLLAGRVALVVGGGGGLGSSVARELVRVGAHTVIASRNVDRCRKVADDLAKEERGTVFALELDIRDSDSCERVVAEVVERTGRLDVIVNSAGGGFQAHIEDVSLRAFEAVLSLNLKGAFYLTQAAGRHMREAGGGAIVHVVSPVTDRPIPGLVHIGAAKAGLILLTQGWALEWASFGIRVNCVAPGIFFTEGARDAIVGNEMFERLRDSTPFRRYGRPEEMGHAIVFLASDASSYITGQCLYVDGGLFIGRGVSFRDV